MTYPAAVPAARRLTMIATLTPARARVTILAALSKADGNISQAAEALEVGRQTLQRLLDRLDLRDEVAKRWPRADR